MTRGVAIGVDAGRWRYDTIEENTIEDDTIEDDMMRLRTMVIR